VFHIPEKFLDALLFLMFRLRADRLMMATDLPPLSDVSNGVYFQAAVGIQQLKLEFRKEGLRLLVSKFLLSCDVCWRVLHDGKVLLEDRREPSLFVGLVNWLWARASSHSSKELFDRAGDSKEKRGKLTFRYKQAGKTLETVARPHRGPNWSKSL
jgi:hypothetical protein